MRLRSVVRYIGVMRRFLRFGLGTLFIVLTAICVFLGTIVRRVLPQQRAVSVILKAGGRVNYDTDVNTWPQQRLAALLGNDWCYSVRSVSLDGESCNEVTVKCLKQLPDVSSLVLYPYRRRVGEPPV